MIKETEIYSVINWIKENVYSKQGIILLNYINNEEGTEYESCCFELAGKKVQHRLSKITPTKSGQFVTIWKRNAMGETSPFDVLDVLDFVIITSKAGEKIGQFIFPKSVLAEKGILSQNGKGGKRGIRVYPAWDITDNKQAEKTQSWQTKYFVCFDNACDGATGLRQLLAAG